MNNQNHTADTNHFTAWLRALVVDGSSMDLRTRRRVYLQTATGALCLIWLPVVLMLAFAPVNYSSRWSLILPGTGAGTAVNLESIGQASATASSPYASNSVDPKVNYKAIATSAPVLAEAAKAVGMDAATFGKPTIKLVDQTALINFRVTGSSGAEAHRKSMALYKALENQVNRLRGDEIDRREEAVRSTLQSFNEKLTGTQQQLVDYQAGARIVSLEQFKELTLVIERLRQQHAALKADLQGVGAQLRMFHSQYGVDPSMVRAALRLQQDEIFQQLLKERSRHAALLSEQRAKWGSQHYELLATKARYNGATSALKKRIAIVTPKAKAPFEQLAIIGTREVQAASVNAIVALATREAGLVAEVAALEEEIRVRQLRLETGSTEVVTLEDLTRKQQVAMAVFTTALARTDLGKSDIYASYPMIQMLAAPTDPASPDTLGRILAIAGAAAGSLFCLMGLWILWIRKNLLRKILKSA